ncbi:MAG: hypothetical protein ACLFNK_00870 [Candidatus Woesearchaeota archaeon]
MKVFTANITEKYSIRQISDILDKPYPLVHRSIQELLEKDFFSKDKHKHISLDYRKNHQVLVYIEHLRSKELLDKNKDISMLREEIIRDFPFGYFVMLIFGSTVNVPDPRDLDLLIIIEDTDEIEKAERYLYNITRNYGLEIHPLVISFESVYEMLASREDNNVMNEVLDKHLILYGAELFYRLLSKGRK